MKLTDEQKASLSPAELEALDGEDIGDINDLRTIAQRLENEGDDDDRGGTGDDTVTGSEGSDTVTGATGDDTVTGAAGNGTGTEQDSAISVKAPFAPKLPEGTQDDYEVKRGELLDERKELREKRRAGEIDQDAYDEQLDSINDRLRTLETSHAVAQTNATNNRETARQQWFWTVDAFKEAVRDQGGIDYNANPGANAMLDAHVKRLAADEANADRPAQWYLSEAHKAVLQDIRTTASALGMVPKDAAKPGDTKPAARPSGQAVKDAVASRVPDRGVVKAMAGTPNAGAADDGSQGGEFAYLDGLKGMALERALAAMPPEKQARYLEEN